MRHLLADIRKWGARRLARLAAAIDPTPEPTPEPAATTPGPATAVDPTPEPGPSQAEPEPGTGAGRSEAEAVLAVADRVTNPELARRLFEAVSRMPGVIPVRPEPGDPFDPVAHQWVETRPAGREADVEHVAELLTPGFLGHSSGLIRPALVAVYDLAED
jgi:hypothetical protein